MNSEVWHVQLLVTTDDNLLTASYKIPVQKVEHGEARGCMVS